MGISISIQVKKTKNFWEDSTVPKIKNKIICLILSLTLLISLFSLTVITGFATDEGITEASGWLESAYAQWNEISGASGYKAYVAPADSSLWTQLDDQLIRKYKDHWRVDAVGLKAGSYKIKIVPVIGGVDSEAKALITDSLTVLPHDRSGFAFVSGSSSGAYNDDGTLKSGAVVIYVTEQTKNSVTATIDGKSYTGLSNILSGSVIKKTSTPICVRFIGNVTDLEEGAAFDKGDLIISEGTSGITIEGIGEDTVLNGFGIRLKRCSNIEIRNLATMNCNSDEGDNVGLQQENDHIWVHNCDFFYGDAGSDADQAKGDGALDTKKSTYITHSYNHFWDCGKVNLQGMKDETTENYITYHHNWFDHSDSRHPRVRTCTVHVYNNFYDGVAKYGIGATSGCSIFSEANYFLNTKNPLLSSKQGTDALGDGTFSGENGGIIKSFGDVFNKSTAPISYANNKTSFDAYFASSRDEQIPSSVKTLSGGTTYNNFDTNSSLMYEYEVQSAADAMNTVKKYAGRVNGGDFKWIFSTADNTGYDVISGLKSALSGYKTSVVAIGGLNKVNTGSDGNGTTGGSSPGAGSGDSTDDDIFNPDTGDGGNGGDNTGGENGGTTTGPITGTYTFNASDVAYGSDKEIISNGTTYADGFFTIEGTVTKRIDSNADVVKSIELAKKGGGAVVFTIGADANVTIVVSSTGDSNTSTFAIVDENGNAVANNEGADTVYGSANGKFTATYNLTAGTYKIVSPANSKYDRGVRLYSAEVVISTPSDVPNTPVDPDLDPDPTPDPDPENPVDPVDPENPDNGETPDTPNEPEQPEEKLNFFQRIWRAIVEFFARLFGKK